MIKITTLAAALLAVPIAAMAAPFCLTIPGGTPMCIYIDGAQCAADAQRQNGYCDVNPDSVQKPVSRVGDYCLIMPDGSTRCGYADPAVCSRDALLNKGVCSKSLGTLPKQIPDSYAPNAGR